MIFDQIKIQPVKLMDAEHVGPPLLARPNQKAAGREPPRALRKTEGPGESLRSHREASVTSVKGTLCSAVFG